MTASQHTPSARRAAAWQAACRVAYLARQVGQKFSREIFFLGQTYNAEAAHRMGMVNAVVPHAELERTALQWAAAINANSPTSQRMLKFAFNLVDDGLGSVSATVVGGNGRTNQAADRAQMPPLTGSRSPGCLLA